MAERGFLTVRGVWLSWLDFGETALPFSRSTGITAAHERS